MNYPVYCEYCGSSRLRRSRRRSGAERVKMLMGSYPFRCQDCNGRFFVNVFLLSRLAYAKCPKCLSLDVTNTVRGHHTSTFQKLLMTFGARKVRCKNCRFMFVSFRPVARPHRFDEELETAEEQPGSGSAMAFAAGARAPR
jgi:DNA-directed RNA polymerase subunit RPC12/RpoP